MVSKSQSKAVTKYIKSNYDRMEVKFRKEDDMPAKIIKHCIKRDYLYENGKPNKSLFFREAVKNQMLIDNGEYELVKKGG